MRRKVILIVDDRPEILKLLKMAMRNLPYDVIQASNAEAGLELVAQKHPDLVLLDVMMPGPLDGLSLCRAIKGNSEFAEIPIVMQSALAQASDLERAREAGADDYLTKPFSLVQLMMTIDRYIGKQGSDHD